MKTSFVMAHAVACLGAVLVLVGAATPGRAQSFASADAGGSATPFTENWTMRWEFISRTSMDESTAAEYSAVHVVFGTQPTGKLGGSQWKATFYPPPIPYVQTNLEFNATVFANAAIGDPLLNYADGHAKMIWIQPGGGISEFNARATVPPDLTKSDSHSNRIQVGNTEFTLYLGLGAQVFL